MSSSPPNVIMLTVDALRADRTSLHGYDRPTTPTLERLARNAVVCDRSYALGTFTQVAFVQILTSSRPLSYGGYDHGALGRPPTIFKRFREAGYHTTCLSTLHWVNRFFNYGEGIDEEYQLFGLNTLPGVALATIRSSLAGYESEDIGREPMLAIVEPALLKMFDNTLEYCALQLERQDELATDFPDSGLTNACFDFVEVRELVERHRQEFLADGLAYVHKHLQPAPTLDNWSQSWLPKEWYYHRKPTRLLGEGLFRTGNRILGMVNPGMARRRGTRFKIYPDAHSLANKVISKIENRDTSKPFFIWTHFMDTHTPYVAGPGRKWYEHTPEYLAALGYPSDIDPTVTFDGKPKRKEDEPAFSALYDAAVRSTDEEIGRIVDALDRFGLREDTLIVISGDHGEELGDHGDFGHYFLLYEHSSRVPTLFHRPGLGAQRFDGLSNIMDIAPTTTALAGIEPAEGWEGVALTDRSSAQRPHVLMETFFAGNCLFDHRPLYLGVRTRDYHYMWKEYCDPGDNFSPPDHQLYHVSADPGEQNNLYRPDHPLVAEFDAVIAARLAELPQISDERLIRLFGPKLARQVRQSTSVGDTSLA